MKKNRFSLFSIAAICSFCSYEGQAQPQTDVTLKANQLVNLLTGGSSNIIISNVTFFWDTVTFFPVGSFTATGTNIGIEKGILLTTGTAITTDDAGPNGPNDYDHATAGSGEPHIDPDLCYIGNHDSTIEVFDAAILEFDFIPCADSIRFRYVFASEEYPEFVCSEYNDAFAFILSGVGTNAMVPVNIATVPGTTTPIAVNTVNGGSVGGSGGPGGCGGPGDPGLANSAYYVDNTGGATIEYDGFTVPIVASYTVSPGKKYHFKIGIADVGDEAWDCAVFMEAGSFISTPYPVDLTVTNDTLCPDQQTSVVNAAFGADSLTYNWNFGDANVLSGTGKGPYSLSWSSSGTKKVKTTGNTVCSGVTDSLYIFVKEACELKFPNVFTPDNDGKNEFFSIKGLQGFKNSDLTIYTRWGNKIFEDPDYQNDWAGSGASDGVYYYVFKTSDGTAFSGFLTIIRKG